MEYRFLAPVHEKASTGRTSIDRGNARGRCIVFSAQGKIDAEALERRNKKWTVRTKAASDLIIQVDDSIFHLHKIPMVSKSGYLNRLVFQRSSNGDKVKLDSFPGGAKVFEIIVKFCYGWKVDLTSANIAPVFCASHFLEMTDDFEQGNLISKTQEFLSFVLFSSWKDMFQILKSCENISSWAKESKILKQCSEAIAWKVCLDPKTFTFSNCDAFSLDVLTDSAVNFKPESIAENWWFEDVSLLRLDHFIEVMESIKRKGVRSELIGSCIAHWTEKWISQIPAGLDSLPKHLTHKLLRVSAESLIRLLPEEKNSVSCNFLLRLFKMGIMLRINSELLNKLECRIALMLEQCCASDLLVKNYGNHSTVYDVGIVIRVVEKYVSSVLKDLAPRILVVGRLINGYLMLVSRDEKLSANDFHALAAALPKHARYCDDNLYRSMDMYLKEHPTLTDEERMNVCRAMDYNKLSQEARQHVMKNERLPIGVSMRLILLEQVSMTKSMTATGSNYQRTQTQAVIRANKGLLLEKRSMTSQKEIRIMKKEVENMKVQLNKLEMCKLQLRRQVNQCVI